MLSFVIGLRWDATITLKVKVKLVFNLATENKICMFFYKKIKIKIY